MEEIGEIKEMKDFFKSFDWEYYNLKNTDIRLSDRECAWIHANSIGWKEKRNIYENTTINEDFITFHCKRHYIKSMNNLSLNNVNISFRRENIYSEYNDLFNYSIELNHRQTTSPVSDSVQKVYCINLLDNDDKLQTFLEMANKYCIDCRIMRMTKLVNSKKFMQIFKTLKPPKKGDFISHKLPGELGCTMSHLICLLDAKYYKYQKIIILEDDAIPIRNVNEHFQNISHILSSSSYVYLGASQHTWFKDIKFQQSYYISHNTMGSFALYIHEDIMDFLINKYKKMDRKIDKVPWIFDQHGQSNSVVLYPNLFIADVSDSDIRGKRDMQTHSKKLRWDLSKYDICEKE